MITVYESLRHLASGGKKSYLHIGKENKKTTELQYWLDIIYFSNPNYYKKYL